MLKTSSVAKNLRKNQHQKKEMNGQEKREKMIEMSAVESASLIFGFQSPQHNYEGMIKVDYYY